MPSPLPNLHSINISTKAANSQHGVPDIPYALTVWQWWWRPGTTTRYDGTAAPAQGFVSSVGGISQSCIAFHTTVPDLKLVCLGVDPLEVDVLLCGLPRSACGGSDGLAAVPLVSLLILTTSEGLS